MKHIKKFKVKVKNHNDITIIREGDFSNKFTYNDLLPYFKEKIKRSQIISIEEVLLK